MPNPKLVGYVEKHVKKGIHPDKIKSVLLKAGHDLEKVEEALVHVHHMNNTKKVLATVAALLLLVALIVIQATTPKEKVVAEVVEAEDLSTEEVIPEVVEQEEVVEEKTPEQIKEEKIWEIINSDTNYKENEAYILAALKQNNIMYCEQITNNDVKQDCKKFVLEGIE